MSYVTKQDLAYAGSFGSTLGGMINDAVYGGKKGDGYTAGKTGVAPSREDNPGAWTAADVFADAVGASKVAAPVSKQEADAAAAEGKGEPAARPMLDLTNQKSINTWLDATGNADRLVSTPGAMAKFHSLLSAARGLKEDGEDGDQWETMSGADYSAQHGLKSPLEGNWQLHKKTGQLRQISEPARQQAPTVPTTRDFTEGDATVTRQFDPNTGQWNEVARGPRWQPQQAKEGPDTWRTLTGDEKRSLMTQAGVDPALGDQFSIQQNTKTGKYDFQRFGQTEMEALMRGLNGGGGGQPAANQPVGEAAKAAATGSGIKNRFDGFGR